MMRQIFWYSLMMGGMLCASSSTLTKYAIVIVIDGCGQDYFRQARPFFKGGLKKLCDEGLFFSSCCYPYAALSTGPGHATISSGALPRDHGIVDNSWINQEGKEVNCDEADPIEAAVLAPTGSYSYGKSPINIMTDTLSDTLLLQGSEKHPNVVISLSAKSRAAIYMGGRMGKAYWFDNQAGRMTTSKYYHDDLPDWMKRFNKSFKPQIKKWKLSYSANNKAYQHVHPPIYGKSPEDKYPQPLAGKKWKTFGDFSTYKLFDLTPRSLEYLAECGVAALNQMIKLKPATGILWISFSSLDKLGHLYGAESLEYVDALYHLDRVLGRFLTKAMQLVGDKELVIVFTADHGNIPMIDSLQKRGCSLARRINPRRLKDEWNKEINQTFGIPDCICRIDEVWVYIPETLMATLEPATRKKVLRWIVNKARATPGIKTAWTADELYHLPSTPHDWIDRYKNQLFTGRTGQVVMQLEPYVYVGKHDTRTGHNSPYFYSTNVPLIWYNPAYPIGKEITTPVWIPQLAPSLAHFLEVPQPSACLYPLLPETLFIAPTS